MDRYMVFGKTEEPSEGIRGQQPGWTHNDVATDTGIGTTAPQQLAYVAQQQSRQDGQIGAAQPILTIQLSRKKYPESVQHIEDAIANGHPSTLTIDRSRTKLNRKASLRGAERKKGRDNDEYPPAMTVEGGKGASVRSISTADNRGAGASMGNQLRGFPNGTQFKIHII